MGFDHPEPSEMATRAMVTILARATVMFSAMFSRKKIKKKNPGLLVF
jgi:hypothetical protein